MTAGPGTLSLKVTFDPFTDVALTCASYCNAFAVTIQLAVAPIFASRAFGQTMLVGVRFLPASWLATCCSGSRGATFFAEVDEPAERTATTMRTRAARCRKRIRPSLSDVCARSAVGVSACRQ